MYKDKMDTILTHEVTREEFLKAGFAVIFSIIGIPALINAITGALKNKKTLSNDKASGGYGSTPYGR